MSLEQALAANTAALEKNTAAILGIATVAADGGARRGPGRPAKGETATAPAAQVPPAPVATPPAAPPPAPAPAAVATPSTTIQQVVALVTKVAQTNRDGVVALLGQFGAPRASDLKPEQYDAFYARLQTVCAPAPAATPGSDLV